MCDFEDIEGTWEHELKRHWDAFSSACEFMREKGHENKIDKFKWREYILYDMQRRHDEEVKTDSTS